MHKGMKALAQVEHGIARYGNMILVLRSHFHWHTQGGPKHVDGLDSPVMTDSVLSAVHCLSFDMQNKGRSGAGIINSYNKN